MPRALKELVTDDDGDRRELARDGLLVHGIEVIEAPAEPEGMRALRAQFLRRSEGKLNTARRIVGLLGETPADRGHLEDLMRFFHSLAGVGTTFGYPSATTAAKEGERECLAVLQSGAAPSITEITNWARRLDVLAHELSQPPVAPARTETTAMVTRPPEVVLISSDSGVAATLVPLLKQDGHDVRQLATHAAAGQAFRGSLPTALIVDGLLDDGSGYEVIDQLRALHGGESVPVFVLSPRGGFLDRVAAIHSGADGYFEKPVDGRALMTRLQDLLDASRTRASRILSVEDDPEQAAYLKSILEPAGYEVAVCGDPKRFEAALRDSRPDLVLMDILLPDISGYDLVRYLRQDERHATLPVLFLTTESQLHSRSRSAQVGGDDHLTKPVVPAVLLSVVASRLERARFLTNLLNRDGLTRLYTHTALIERARALHAQKAREPARQCAFVMIDLDHFKSVNDRFGHPVGDRVLASLAALLRRRLRQSDTIGRYGGEEFAVLFEGLPAHDVLRLMERVLEEFREMGFEVPGKPPFRATFSAGVAMLAEGATLDEWKAAADAALYASKAAGRNCLTATAAALATS